MGLSRSITSPGGSGGPPGPPGPVSSVGAASPITTTGGGAPTIGIRGFQSNATVTTAPVASAANAIAIGNASIASGVGSTVVGGLDGHAQGTYAAVAGGRQCTAEADFSTIGGGFDNDCQPGALYSCIPGGTNINQYSPYGICAGLNNINQGIASVCFGSDCRTIGDYSVNCGGVANVAGPGTSYTFCGGGTVNQVLDGYGVVCGGLNNTTNAGAAAGNAAIVGGQANTATGVSSFIGAGISNTCAGAQSVICGGYIQSTSGSFSFIGGGISNTTVGGGIATCCGGDTNRATGDYSFVGGGQTNTASGVHSCVPGGLSNTASGESSVAMGRNAIARLLGQVTMASGRVANIGDAQTSVVTLIGSTAGVGAGESVELLIGNADSFILQNDRGYTLVVEVVASGAISAVQTTRSFKQTLVMQRTGGTTTLSASGTQEALGTGGGASWTFAATVGAGPDRVVLTFTTGATTAKTNVSARVFMTEVTSL